MAHKIREATDMTIRQLDASDATAFQTLRLFGLQESPSAFASSFFEESGRTILQVEAHLTQSSERVFYGCFFDSNLFGIIGVGREQGRNQRHISFIRSVYVAPTARGLGIGSRLLEAGLAQAASWSGVEQTTLTVTASSVAAVHLYQSAGFVEVGRMPRALRIENNYFDEIIMFRPTIGSSAIPNSS